MSVAQMLSQLHGKLIVSCQAYPGEPMRDPAIMAAVARAALEGGAAGIRAQGIGDIEAIRLYTNAPLIGLLKVDGADVFITPTVADAVHVATAGADIIALDGTDRSRPDGLTLSDSIDAIHATGKVAMADCGSLNDAHYSVAAGADCVSTTLAGYTESRPPSIGPDLDLLAELVASMPVPVFAEGRIRHPADARRCLDAGAYAVVVGTAITHPTRLTQSFVAELHACESAQA